MTTVTYGMVRGHVSDALLRILRLRRHDWLVVIRQIDSASSQEDLTKALAFHCVPYQLINGNVCVSIDAVQSAVEELFTGFDEVWIVSGKPPSFDLASLPHATSESTDFSSGVPDEVLSAMDRTNCVVILGDGCGLNYATTAEEIQQEIVKIAS